MGRSWLVLRNRWFKNYFQNRSWDGLTRNVPSRPSLISNLFAWPLSTSFLYQGIFSKSFAMEYSYSHLNLWLEMNYSQYRIAGANLNLIYYEVIILRVVLFATHYNSSFMSPNDTRCTHLNKNNCLECFQYLQSICFLPSTIPFSHSRLEGFLKVHGSRIPFIP